MMPPRLLGWDVQRETDLKVLRNMLAEAETILATTTLPPQDRAERARELLAVALQLADHLMSENPTAKVGARGGKKTAERGKDRNQAEEQEGRPSQG